MSDRLESRLGLASGHVGDLGQYDRVAAVQRVDDPLGGLIGHIGRPQQSPRAAGAGVAHPFGAAVMPHDQDPIDIGEGPLTLLIRIAVKASRGPPARPRGTGEFPDGSVGVERAPKPAERLITDVVQGVAR